MLFRSNAIKYTLADGQIKVSLAELPTSVTIDVSDNGPGIKADVRGRVFDRFYRATTPALDEMVGTGLGLSLAKWAVEVNGGRLTLVERANELGTTFRITLPRASARMREEVLTATA